MKSFYRKILCTFVAFILVFMLCACSRTVENSADELTRSLWSTSLENGTAVTLSFDDTNATFKVVFSDGDTAVISGFCELSKNQFVIHDTKTLTPYAFEYIVHSDCVKVKNNSKIVSLHKSE